MSEEPFVFVDRSLGRIAVPNALRAAGIELVTLAEHYGIPADESVEDTTWIREAASRGWIMIMKDERIRRRPAERILINELGARCFCLANANLAAAAMARRYLDNWARIIQASAEPGPYLYSVRATEIVKLSIE
jgi:hypothetical protein